MVWVLLYPLLRATRCFRGNRPNRPIANPLEGSLCVAGQSSYKRCSGYRRRCQLDWVSSSSSISVSLSSTRVKISSSAVRIDCSWTSYRPASRRSNQASAPILRGVRSSPFLPKSTSIAKPSGSSWSPGNQRVGTSGDRVNHLRPFEPWHTNTEGECPFSTSLIAVAVRLASNLSDISRIAWKFNIEYIWEIGSKRYLGIRRSAA